MSEATFDWPKLMEEALTAPGNLGNTYSRFHDYSLTNMLLFRMQGLFEPIAPYSRWKALGRNVIRGSRAKEVIVPVLINEAPADQTLEEKRERVARLVGFKVVRAVFGLSDTEGPDIPPVPSPGWDLQQVLGRLGIREAPFDNANGNLQGWSHGVDFAITPIAVNRTKTTFHELGHIVLGHTIPARHAEYATHRGIGEFQAEAVAYLAMNELGQLDDEIASRSRGYIQHWLRDERPPDRAIQHVFRATGAILKAGRVAVEAAE
jgi:hypothetical protein